MRVKPLRRWIGPASTALIGILGALLAQTGVIPDLMYKGDFYFPLSALILSISLLAAIIWAVISVSGMVREKQLQRSLMQARAAQAQEKQRFIRRLDHELKNPITTIRLGVANLQERHRGDAEVSGSLEHITNQVQRLQSLVENLRRLVELDESSLDLALVDLPEVLEDALELAGTGEQAGRKVELTIQQVPWPIAHIRADRDMLLVAFRNLIENALKFSAPQGRVEVRASEDGHQVLIEVDDNGRGISPEDLPLVFDELSRGTNARDVPGSGLGLALARRIIELHHGSLTVNSRLDQGTMVRVQLPIE